MIVFPVSPLLICGTDVRTNKPRPVPPPFLLALDSIDAEDLEAAHDEFLRVSRPAETKGEVLSDTETRLGFGITDDFDTYYNLVTFGRRLTGLDSVEADRRNLQGSARLLFDAAMQITKIKCEETGAELTAPFEENFFERVDIEDFDTLYAGGERFRQSFRPRGKAIQGEPSDDDADFDERDENE